MQQILLKFYSIFSFAFIFLLFKFCWQNRHIPNNSLVKIIKCIIIMGLDKFCGSYLSSTSISTTIRWKELGAKVLII